MNKKIIKKKYRIIKGKEAIGKIAHCSLGHIVVVCGDEDSGSTECMIVKENNGYPINRSCGEMTNIASPYIELTKKDLLLLHSGTIDCNKLRKRFETASKITQ